MESDIKRHGPSEQVHVEKKQERRAGQEEPSRTPGSAEGGGLEKERSRPYPDEPKRTPGKAEG